MARIYLIGSLRNSAVPQVAAALRAEGHHVFDDWHAAGAAADDEWQRYEKTRGRTYGEALDGEAARHVFEFDLAQLLAADAAVLVAPAGRSAHMELGFMLGRGKKGYVLFDQEPDRWDVMYKFASGVCFSVAHLTGLLSAQPATRSHPASKPAYDDR